MNTKLKYKIQIMECQTELLFYFIFLFFVAWFEFCIVYGLVSVPLHFHILLNRSQYFYSVQILHLSPATHPLTPVPCLISKLCHHPYYINSSSFSTELNNKLSQEDFFIRLNLELSDDGL